MVIKKYKAETENDAMILVKEDLGKDAIVMNIKSIRPKGIFRFFRRPLVEITAAYDDTTEVKSHQAIVKDSVNHASFHKDYNQAFMRGDILIDGIGTEVKKVRESSAIEVKLDNLQTMLEKQIASEAIKKEPQKEEEKEVVKSFFDNACVKLIMEKLSDNDVTKENVNSIIKEVENRINKDTTIDNILSHVYQKIVLKLGQPKTITLNREGTKFIYFVGPTGVGKTTSIAKLVSSIKIKNNIKVGLITLDTYRIAAVEQLRTYANILNIPFRVVYSNNELKQAREEFKDYDLVLVDTAGRSHKNEDQINDIRDMIETTPEEFREIYLVLSITTKYKDLLQIVESYKKITDYNLIFTKLDETSSLGNILNIRMLTQAPLSYTTWGQNVPDDIGKVNAQMIAKQLLGGMD